VYEAHKDAAALLRLSDLLISDYSSIFFDYLLLDKPIVFFPYDYEKYCSRDRSFLFDYEEYTPGAKCGDQETLFRTVLTELAAPSEVWARKRQELRARSFTALDGDASLRLWTEIESLH
jgi:CDP-glycerol glycerophosphotransferase